ncbi:hypothetical protein IAI18_04580 [Acetobacteraceae bacterium H6797]|nr:hypothetical protein [Acetobacteraceae bacterium H6797]
MADPLVIRPVSGAAEEAAFVRLPAMLGGHAAGWSVTPFGDARKFLSPSTNPALAEWHSQKFLAWRGEQPVGRIMAAWPRHADEAQPGHFGFLATEPEQETVTRLLAAARDALRYWGAKSMRGPLSFSINHETGAMIAGFDRPGMVKMPRSPAWLPAMIDAAGLTPEKDVHAHTLNLAEERHRAAFAPRLAAWPEKEKLAIRRISPGRWLAEMRLIVELFNDAWAENWAAMPVSPIEADMIARLMRPIAVSGAVFVAEWEGQPIGVLSIIPNVEEATEDRDGRLGVKGTLNLLGAALLGRTRSARIAMLGIIRAYRDTEISSMAVGSLLTAALDFAQKREWSEVEISWVLDDNARMKRVMARLPAPVTKSWRVWHAPL